MTEAYPLQWPTGWPRTAEPTRALFQTSLAGARDGLLYELNKMNAKHIVINSNMVLRRDGLPYANQSRLDDTGVAVYFMLNEQQRCIPCDRWNMVEDNLQAIRRTVEALRGLDRWGAKAVVDAAFSGFKAIPAEAIVVNEPWYETLGVPADASPSTIRKAFTAFAKQHHPDVGGDPDTYAKYYAAYKKGLS
jgi:hypothetical protein